MTLLTESKDDAPDVEADTDRLLDALRVIEGIAAAEELLPDRIETDTEKSLHEAICAIFRVAHIARQSCQAEHEDWEEEFQRLADQLFKQ